MLNDLLLTNLFYQGDRSKYDSYFTISIGYTTPIWGGTYEVRHNT